jgi:hypothetical protein
MRNSPIDDGSAEPAEARGHDGTDLPSVIARLGRRLAWRSPDAAPAGAPSHPTISRDAPQIAGPARAGSLAPRRPPR